MHNGNPPISESDRDRVGRRYVLPDRKMTHACRLAPEGGRCAGFNRGASVTTSRHSAEGSSAAPPPFDYRELPPDLWTSDVWAIGHSAPAPKRLSLAVGEECTVPRNLAAPPPPLPSSRLMAPAASWFDWGGGSPLEFWDLHRNLDAVRGDRSSPSS